MLWMYKGGRKLAMVVLVGSLALAGCGGGSSKSSAGATPTTPTTSTTVPPVVAPNAVQRTLVATDASGTAPATMTWTETRTQDGSYRNTAADGSDDEAFDATARVSYSHLVHDGNASLNIRNNVSFAAPDEGTQQMDALAQYVMAKVAVNDPGVTDVKQLGRDAWRLQFDSSSSALPFDHADVVVDKITGLALLIDTTKAAKPYQRLEVTNFDAAPDLSKVSFSINPAASDDVNRSDDGFIDTQASLVKSQVGYDALIPQTVPAGFTLTRIITHAAKGETTGADGANPQSEGVVAEMFKNGWFKLYVTTRNTAGDVGKWSDPFVSLADQFKSGVAPVSLAAGALTQARGQSVVAPAEAPHIWVAGSTLVATVSGPFSSDVLAAAANSLA